MKDIEHLEHILDDGDDLYNDSESENTQMYEHHRFLADKGQGLMRIDKFLSIRIEGISRSLIQKAAAAKCILVNDVAVKASYRVKPLDVVSLVMDRPKMELEILPEDISLDIVYEDDDLMVINKKPGMVVHPGHGNYTGTLVNAIAYHLQYEEGMDMSDPRLGLVHRIDKDTSGLLLIAKTEDAKINLARQFFNKTTKRRYVALVWGNIDRDEGTIDGNIGRDPKNRLLMNVFVDGSQGKPATTHYKVLERFGYVTLVECALETGRTHQIRVHMKHIGHTLFNDERYGGDEVLRGNRFAKYKQFVQNCFTMCPRQCLHAKVLGFIHPRTGEEMIFETDLPEDIQNVLERWRVYSATLEEN